MGVADLLQWDPESDDSDLPPCFTYEKPPPRKQKASNLGEEPPANAKSLREQLADMVTGLKRNRNARKDEDFERNGVEALPLNGQLALILEGSSSSKAVKRMRQRRQPASEWKDGWRGIQYSVLKVLSAFCKSFRKSIKQSEKHTENSFSIWKV